ncbi:MAG: pantoate--beta-alanine ligase, partial [Putridiphycobacter sp.]|nr:pantoate--beta-alanine ligase [Putridiphycobacter sp.]
MKIVKTSNELKAVLGNWKSDNPTGVVGLIPTMGALHEGHMTLLAAARETCDLVVVSVFVNPTQFNDAKDLERYPRTEEADAAMLASHQCDIMFLP